jgi:anti-anti-sigma regulatory factor
VCIVLHGELDITSMQYFERVLAEVMSSDPSGLIFDVSGAEFIAGQAYEAMARCSRTTRVEVRGVGAVASRILAAYGYHHSVV